MQRSGGAAGLVTTIVLVALPLVLLAGALGFGAWTWNAVQGSDPVEGTVISVETVPIDGGATYRPTFGYADAAGNRRRATTPWASSEYDFAVGDQVRLLVPHDAPNLARIDSVEDLWLLPGVLLAVAVVVAALSVGFLMVTRRPRARAGAAPERPHAP